MPKPDSIENADAPPRSRPELVRAVESAPTSPRVSPARAAAGVVAVAALAGLALILPDTGELRQPAMVEPARSYTFAAVDVGRYEATLVDSSHPRGPTAVKRTVFRFDESELLEIELPEGLDRALFVEEGQVLARFHSPHHKRILEELRAERSSLEAQRALLAAGGRVEEVDEALRRIQVARARRDEDQAELARVRALAPSGAVSQADLEEAELRDEVRRLEIELEEATLAAIRAGARPEAIAEVEARFGAADARITELERLLSGDLVASPIAGRVELGGTGPQGEALVLEVHDLSEVYLRVPVPHDARRRVELGFPVTFASAAYPGRRFEGALTAIADEATAFGGGLVFWATARVDNADGALLAGMTGQARVPLAEGGSNLLASLWEEVAGP